MARRTAAEKAATHAEIVRHAAQAFRKRGSGVGIGDVMDELGLTHGGFYRHFAGKDALLVEALTLALREIAERLTRAAERAAPGEERAAIIRTYLSSEHLLHPETWCALATLAPEIGRRPAAIRKQLDGAMWEYARALAPYMPGASDDERFANFVILFSGMAGTIAMCRALGDKTMRDRMLATARAYYLRTFAGGAETSGAR